MSEFLPDSSQTDPNGTSGVTALAPDSPFIDLNAIVLSIEWEITDEIMAKLLVEIERLKEKNRKSKTIYSFLQLHGSVGRYIKTKKVAAHPDSVRLLLSVHEGLMTIVTRPHMTSAEKNALLSAEIGKFKRLKNRILQTARQDVRRAPDKSGEVQAAKSTDVAPEAIPEAVAVAIAEIKTLIRNEFKILRAELKSLARKR